MVNLLYNACHCEPVRYMGPPQRRIAFVGRGEVKIRVEFPACRKWNIVSCTSTTWQSVRRAAGVKASPTLFVIDSMLPPLDRTCLFCCHPERSEAQPKDLGIIESAKIPPLATLGRNDSEFRALRLQTAQERQYKTVVSAKIPRFS